MKDLEEAKKFFSNDKYAVDQTGIEIVAVDDNYSKCSMKIRECHLNAVKALMGAVPYTLADYSFAIATNSPGHHVVTTNSTITYLSVPKGDTLLSECKLIKDGRTLCTYEINITDNLGTKVAIVISNGFKV
ncbi:MAG: PaaI family thioesterase [Treponema sp.]|nr:PaaI family thioesterase [Treponema sp.]